MVNPAAKPQRKNGLQRPGARGPLARDVARATLAPSLPRPANLEQSLRRIRTELALILTAVDDGLQRIEAQRNFNLGDMEHGAASES